MRSARYHTRSPWSWSARCPALACRSRGRGRRRETCSRPRARASRRCRARPDDHLPIQPVLDLSIGDEDAGLVPLAGRARSVGRGRVEIVERACAVRREARVGVAGVVEKLHLQPRLPRRLQPVRLLDVVEDAAVAARGHLPLELQVEVFVAAGAHEVAAGRGARCERERSVFYAPRARRVGAAVALPAAQRLPVEEAHPAIGVGQGGGWLHRARPTAGGEQGQREKKSDRVIGVKRRRREAWNIGAYWHEIVFIRWRTSPSAVAASAGTRGLPGIHRASRPSGQAPCYSGGRCRRLRPS